MTVTFTTVSAGEQVLAAHHNELASALDGTPGGGKILAFTALSSNTNPALTVRNQGTAGAFLVQSAAGATILSVTDAASFGLFRDKGGAVYNVKAYGAVGDGVTDDTTAIRAAIAAAAIFWGSTVYFPPGTYLITTTLAITKGIFLQGSYGDDAASGAGSNSTATRIAWGGANGGTMIFVASATTYNFVIGGGIDQIVLDGFVSNTVQAGTALWLKGTTHYHAKRLAVRNVTIQGILLDDWATTAQGAPSTDNVIEDYEFSHGFWTGAALLGANACGLVLNGSSVDGGGLHSAFGGSTQNTVHRIRGTFYAGDLVRCVFADNNHIDDVHATPTGAGAWGAAGTGYAVNLQTAATNVLDVAYGFPAGNVFDVVNGNVLAGDYSHGNEIKRHLSENGKITAQTTDWSRAQLHYRALDYVNLGIWRTHEYKMIDEYAIAAGAMSALSGAPTLSGLASQLSGWTLPDGSTTTIGGTDRPHAWSAGTIVKARVYYFGDANGTATVNFSLSVNTYTSHVPGSAAALPAATTVAVTPATSTTLAQACYVDITLNRAYALGDDVAFWLARAGLADAYAGNIVVTKIVLFFSSLGPPNVTALGSYGYTVSPPALSPF